MRRTLSVQAPDWGKLIDDLIGAGETLRGIAGKMGFTVMTESMVRSYRSGIQPPFWRGDPLVAYWCAVMKQKRDQVPMVPVVRGHRVQRQAVDTSPKVLNLPAWPVATTQQSGLIARKKRGRVAA